MTTRDYGQYCGLARALDVVGERWALLVVRDLFSGPHRFGELQTGLPRIPSNVLTTRLRELEGAGVVERVLLPPPGRGTAYALTTDGRALEPVLVGLGRWGATRLGEPREGEVVTPESFAMALRTTFRPESVAPDERTTYEVHLGDVLVTALVDGPSVDVRVGPAPTPPGPDVTLITGPDVKTLLAGEISPADAVERGVVRVEGDARLLDRFAATFRI